MYTFPELELQARVKTSGLTYKVDSEFFAPLVWTTHWPRTPTTFDLASKSVKIIEVSRQ